MKSFKIKFVPLVMALLIALLSSYTCYTYAECRENATIITIGVFLMLFGTLFGMMGFTYEHKRNMTMIRTVSSIFFFIALITNVVFSFLMFTISIYVIINGFIGITYFMSIYYIVKSVE